MIQILGLIYTAWLMYTVILSNVIDVATTEEAAHEYSRQTSV